MAISRFQREIERTAGPKFARGFLMLFAIGALAGLLVGVVWVIAGLVNYYFLR